MNGTLVVKSDHNTTDITSTSGSKTTVENNVQVTILQSAVVGPQGAQGAPGVSIGMSLVFDESAFRGDLIYIDPVTRRAKRASNLFLASSMVVGILSVAVIVGYAADVATIGLFSKDSWIYSTGSLFLVVGADYYLDNSNGMMTTNATTILGTSVVYVGKAVSPTTINIQIGSPILL